MSDLITYVHPKHEHTITVQPFETVRIRHLARAGWSPVEGEPVEPDPEPTPETIEDLVDVYPDLPAEDAPLPDDMPAREALTAAGVNTLADLLHFGDLTEIDGIGPATLRKINAHPTVALYGGIME